MCRWLMAWVVWRGTQSGISGTESSTRGQTQGPVKKMKFPGRPIGDRLPLVFLMPVVVAAPQGVVVPRWGRVGSWGWLQHGDGSPAPPCPPTSCHQPGEMSSHLPLAVDAVQQGSDVKLRLFPTGWPDLAKIRLWHGILGQQGSMLLLLQT